MEKIFALGQARYNAGYPAEAENFLDMVLSIDPDHAGAMNLKGLAALRLGRPEEAVALLSRAVATAPGNADFHFNLGGTLKYLGRFSEAAAAFRQARALCPGNLDILASLATSLRDDGDHAGLLGASEEIIALTPDHPFGYCGRARARLASGDPAGALSDADRALLLDPDNYEAVGIRASARTESGDFDGALDDSRMHLALDTQSAVSHRNLAMHLLRAGDFHEGFREYEWRSSCKDFKEMGYPGPRWRGEAAADKTLLVHPEQGLGDLIMFARFLPQAAARVGRLITCVPDSLRSLVMRMPGIAEVVPFGHPLPPYDLQISLLSLPHVLGCGEEAIRNAVPYLRPFPERVAEWSRRLDEKDDLRPLIGLIWQGNPAFIEDARRSPPLRLYEGILRDNGCRFISLQKEFGIEQIAGLSPDCRVEEIGSGFADFEDTAAVLSRLDLLIASDTSVVNLAGALGVKTWLCLQTAGDWRWMRGEDTPWYPSIRIFRQKKPGDWPELFTRLGRAFAEWRDGR